MRLYSISRVAGIILYLTLAFMMPVHAQKWKKTSEMLVVDDPPFRQCHASTLVELSTGKLMAAWFGGSHEGSQDVVIWTSIFQNGNWSKPVLTAEGTVNATSRYPVWNPVLFKDYDNTLRLFYKVGPNPRTWWGMEMSSSDEGKTWSSPTRLPKGILGPIKNKPFLPGNDVILSPSSTETEHQWKAHIERSSDNGKTWTVIPIDTAGTFDVIQPSILKYSDGRLQALCRSKQGYVMQTWSSDGGNTWSKLSKTSLLNPNSGTDAVSLKNGLHLIVYNPDVPGKDWWNGRSKLHVAISSDGVEWTDIAVLENKEKGEFSYPAVIQTTDGKVHITYTYDRQNIKYVVLEPTH